MPLKVLYTAAELASSIGISRHMVDELVRAQGMFVYRIGRYNLAHLVGRQARQLREGDARLPLGVRAVEEEHVQMGMELQVGARTLHDDDGATLSARHAFLPQALTVEAEQCSHGCASRLRVARRRARGAFARGTAR
jgi:hypothetical protein